MELYEKTRKRLILNISEEFHAQVKRYAEKRNLTLKTYTLQALAWRMLREEVK